MARIDALGAITPETLGEIHDAIVAGYDHDSLGRLLRYNWGLKLANEFDVSHGLNKLVDELVDYAEAGGRLFELLGLAYAGQPGNPKLHSAADRYLANPDAALSKYVGDKPALPGSLEALVQSHSRLFDYGKFLERVRALGARLCRVEVADKRGTGWLVGASHALTNFHVAGDVIEDRVAVGELVCRFDFWAERENDPAPTGTPIKVDAIVASSRYSESDVSGTGSPAEGELDYALMKLAEPVGNSNDRDSAKRGWFEFTSEQPIIARGDIAMIPQHAQARPLEVAYGNVVDFPATGLRYRYDVTTEPGSSGSPVFTPDLALFGLHHAADPKQNPTFNQAVPVWRVARDLETKQIVWAD